MVIVVVGASGGLGQYVAEQLAKEYEVWGTYHSQPVEIPAVGMMKLDVRDTLEADTFAARIASFCVRSEVTLINMASISCANLVHHLSVVDWLTVITTNLNGTFNICRGAVGAMRLSGRGGRIINISSVVPHLGVPGTSAYSASKMGVEGLTKVLAKENAKNGITVNALALGYFDRGMIETVPEKMLEKIKASIPIGHLGHPKNIVAAIRFLIEADYVTGTVLHIDGGLT